MGYIHHRGPSTPRIVRHDAVQVDVFLSSTRVYSTLQSSRVEAKAASRHRMHLFGRRAAENGVAIFGICMLEEGTGYILAKKIQTSFEKKKKASCETGDNGNAMFP